MLRTVGNALVNIHGQHDSQTLLDPAAHVHLVDKLAESDRNLTAYQSVFHQFLSVRRRLKALTADEEGYLAAREAALQNPADSFDPCLDLLPLPEDSIPLM